ncbi:MAG TPA: hypothetical protein VGK58_07075 [Lacipirellulaceae bacterium]
MNSRQFSLRTLLSAATGVAFVAFVMHWFLFDLELPLVLVLTQVVPWALGSFGGIAVAAQRNGSTLAGAMIGGTLATFIFPGLPILYLYFNGLNGVHSLGSNLAGPLALAACGSGLLGAIVAIPREGFQLRRDRMNQNESKGTGVIDSRTLPAN